MFDANGDFIFEHDLEAGSWDGHDYDCLSPFDACSCLGAEAGLSWIDENGDFHNDFLDDEESDDYSDEWIDFFTYVEGR